MEKTRYWLIDALRGLALVNMLAFHFLYDVFVVFGREPTWYLRPGVRIWQQGICWSFILIAGFSFTWGRAHNLRRGLLLTLCGFLITAVTLIAVPSEAIWFGVLNLLGACVLLTIPLEKPLARIPAALGLALFAALFFLFRPVSAGHLAFGIPLPRALYTCRVLTPLGFPYPGFRSSDYFPLLPWYFLFLCGFTLKRLFDRCPAAQRLAQVKIPLLSAIGQKTLWVYMLHQPVLMGVCLLLHRLQLL